MGKQQWQLARRLRPGCGWCAGRVSPTQLTLTMNSCSEGSSTVQPSFSTRRKMYCFMKVQAKKELEWPHVCTMSARRRVGAAASGEAWLQGAAAWQEIKHFSNSHMGRHGQATLCV